MSQPSTAGTYVIFRLGKEEYGLPVSAVLGIVRYEEPTPVPRAPASVLGVVNQRGRVLPVVDLGERFSGSQFEPRPSSRIVITDGSVGPVGIAVDVASEVASFTEEEIRPVPESVLSADTVRAFSGMVERPGGIVVLLDPEEATPRLGIADAGVGGTAVKEVGSDV